MRKMSKGLGEGHVRCVGILLSKQLGGATDGELVLRVVLGFLCLDTWLRLADSLI